MNLSSTDFELFGLQTRFELDLEALDTIRRSLQAETHPDRFAAHGAAAQRIAMQWSVRLNEAHGRLKDPVRRAAYLCELGGVDIAAETNTAMPPAFLMQQMAWRESLDDAASLTEVEALAATVAAERRQAFAALQRLIDVDGNLYAAAAQVRALMFVERFGADIDQRTEALDPSLTLNS